MRVVKARRPSSLSLSWRACWRSPCSVIHEIGYKVSGLRTCMREMPCRSLYTSRKTTGPVSSSTDRALALRCAISFNTASQKYCLGVLIIRAFGTVWFIQGLNPDRRLPRRISARPSYCVKRGSRDRSASKSMSAYTPPYW